jgi:hypothetical protein
MPRHLINLKRLAFETRSYEQAVAGAAVTPRAEAPSMPVSAPPAGVGVAAGPAPGRAQEETAALRQRISGALEAHRLAPPATPPRPRPLPEPSRSPASTGMRGEPGREPRQTVAAVPFVSEADVRQAVNEKRCIPVDARTIITPSARDLGQEHRVFQYL